ncbi:MAG: NAD(P)H-dependent oxidoreductase subunit E [Planctomycetota bacterium]|jgi:NADH:ubiquinone oxidoreductase subunit F (NADH-binding)/NADH:ubiquinone oxidoreductase subunit E/Pyruvate/2-oxoacid:ferredoxin oxidoreductase delta subunit
MDKLDLTLVDKAVERIGAGPEKVLEILQAVQGRFGYLPREALERVCELTEITPASIVGVSSFYNQFRHRPVGRHIIHVCVGTACHVKGASQVYEAFLRHLDIGEGEDTDSQKLFTVEKIACLGCCTLAPAAQIGQVTYGHLTAETVPTVISDFLQYEEMRARRKPARRELQVDEGAYSGEIRLGLGSCCVARGSGKLREALEQALRETGVRVSVKRVGCVGMCFQTPLLEAVLPDNRSFLYAKVRPEDAKAIVLRHFKPRGIRRISSAASNVLDNILTDERWVPVTRYAIDVREEPVSDFLSKQKHIATEHCGHIDPVDIDEYLSNDGFKALQRCLKELSPEQVIREIEISGLRGRGGAGYPTHLKWSAVRRQDGRKKYVLCNGDEGDPGAFMDRMIMESYPYRIIEGVTIAARTVGADEGYFYIRAEYPLAIERMGKALEQCRQRGFLGDNILGTQFSLHMKIVAGAGAFVCGEETALMASIEGRRGMPRLRPPYPAESGLWSAPTLINNVETYAVVPWIIRHGGEELARLGTSGSKGTKVFALAGKIAHGGLIEVPMGISIREIIEDIGGGIAGGKRFKAVQIGGPSGGCVPAELAHIPVDYETLHDVGAMMGSGGLVALDESDCMVDIARYFLEFTQNQSCGKCTFCRIGTRRMLDILERLCGGEGKKGDIEELQHLAEIVKKGSLCGLGGTAPNPVLSTIRYFRDEYEAHLQKRCPAGRCKALITYSVTDDCIGCTLCAQHCPADAIEMIPYEKHEIDVEKCIRCGTCRNICPADAIEVK